MRLPSSAGETTFISKLLQNSAGVNFDAINLEQVEIGEHETNTDFPEELKSIIDFSLYNMG